MKLIHDFIDKDRCAKKFGYFFKIYFNLFKKNCDKSGTTTSEIVLPTAVA